MADGKIDPRDWDAVHEAARGSLAVFTQLAWPELNRGTPMIFARHNEVICDHLEAVSAGQIRKLIVCVPPGHSKTTHAAQAWPVWQWLRNPSTRWGCAAYGAELSKRDSVKRRDLISSRWFRDSFKPSWALKGDESLKMVFANDMGGEMRATSVGGAATGFHFDFLLTDDANKALDIYTVRLGQAVQWYEEQWASRLRDPNKSAQVIIGQRLHDRDLPGVKMLDPSWTVLRLPMEYEKKFHCVTSIGWQDWRTTEGELLCPERFGPEFVADKKKNARVWAAQYQQRPTVGDGTIFKESWFRFYYLDEPIDGAVPYPGDEAMEKWVGSWDMTFDGGAKSDYVVGQVWAKKGPMVYLRDQVREQMRFTVQRRAALRLGRKWPEVRRWLVENKANGAAIIDTLRRPLTREDGVDDEEQTGLPGVIPVNPKEPKIVRAEAVASYFEAGNVVLPHPSIAPWVADYIEELTAFPTGGNDDQVDSTTQALRDIYRASAVTSDDYDAILPTTLGTPPPGRTGSGITDPREEQRALELAAKEAQEEERWKQRERERIAARLGLNIDPGAVFTTRR